jgi:multidrug transporter EmrE-like cation transporter
MIQYIPLIFLGVLLNATAQLFLRKGMTTIAPFELSWRELVPAAMSAALNPFVAAGLACHVISVGAWMLVLSRVEVSFAYPFQGIGYVFTAIVGYYYFQENLGATRIAGIALICLGVALISRSGTPAA